jgi:hypothetical protein
VSPTFTDRGMENVEARKTRRKQANFLKFCNGESESKAAAGASCLSSSLFPSVLYLMMSDE